MGSSFAGSARISREKTGIPPAAPGEQERFDPDEISGARAALRRKKLLRLMQSFCGVPADEVIKTRPPR
jgi:hypothetical protein